MHSVEQKIDRKSEFEVQGYTVYRNFFSKEEMTELVKEIQRSEPQSSEPDVLTTKYMTFYANIFQKSPYLQSFISQHKIVDLLRDIIGPDIWVRWDQAVEKKPGGEEFPWHQDNGYNDIQDAHYQLWIALTDMNQENGGLWLQPGSHKYGILSHERIDNNKVSLGNPEKAVFIEAEKGDIILFSSLMLHRTSPNISNSNRWAYVVEYMSTDQYDPYLEPPYFVVARGGVSSPGFVRFYRGQLNPKKQVKYLIPRIRKIKWMVREKWKNLMAMS